MNQIIRMLRTQASFVAVATVIFLAGCAGLGSMEKAIETLNLNVNPGTLILRGDIVEVEPQGALLVMQILHRSSHPWA